MSKKDKTPMDPIVEPPDYKPPQRGEELLERYRRGERYFVEARAQLAHLDGANLQGANLSLASMHGVFLTGANLSAAILRDAHLVDAKLSNANLKGADLRKAILEMARLQGASLQLADLREANLRAARLEKANFDGAKVGGAFVNETTYSLSNWNTGDLQWWYAHDAVIESWPPVSAAILDMITGQNLEGLTLFFNTRLTPFDRFLVDGVIFGVLGKETDCHVAQYEKKAETAIVRLVAKKRNDLEAVADALWEKVWEQQERAQQAALMRLTQGLAVQLQPSLSDLRDKLDHIELRLPSKENLEGLDDIGRGRVLQKDLKLIRTWPEKAIRAVGRRLGKTLGDDGVDALKGLLPGKDDDSD